jgi:hypothetical protein
MPGSLLFVVVFLTIFKLFEAHLAKSENLFIFKVPGTLLISISLNKAHIVMALFHKTTIDKIWIPFNNITSKTSETSDRHLII